MTESTRTDRRKAPRQERARATVEAILRATAHILVADGFDRLTTNRVAERAGVSIGSLYQYFPSKEALVAAVVDAHIDEMTSLIVTELGRVTSEPFEEATRRIVDVLIEAHRVDPELHRAIVEQVPRVGRMARLREVDRDLIAFIEGALETRKDELRVKDTRLCAFMLVHAARAITVAALFDEPEYFERGKLAKELTLLFVRYAAEDP